MTPGERAKNAHTRPDRRQQGKEYSAHGGWLSNCDCRFFIYVDATQLLGRRQAIYFCNCPTVQPMLNSGSNPAACQVEPAVISVRSISTTSDQPNLTRWYNVLTPTTPPPMTTTRACVFMCSRFLLMAGGA